jgi:hypothetical protein
MTSTTKDIAAIVASVAGLLAMVAIPIAAIAAWITHVIVCIQASAWVLLAFGCIIAPVGVIHGVGIWFGAF